jgi:hypothetical protein
VVHRERSRPSAARELDRVSGAGSDQGFGEVDPAPYSVEIRPDLQRFEELLPSHFRHEDRCGAVSVPPRVGREPGDEAGDVVRVAVGEEHGLLLCQQRRAASHVNCCIEIIDHECGGERRDRRSDELDGSAAEPKFTAAGVDMTAVRKLIVGVGDPDDPRPSGAGTIYVDDIRLTRSAPIE